MLINKNDIIYRVVYYCGNIADLKIKDITIISSDEISITDLRYLLAHGYHIKRDVMIFYNNYDGNYLYGVYNDNKKSLIAFIRNRNLNYLLS